MLWKLLKHEFRAAGRILLPVWAALLVLAVFTQIASRILDASTAVVLELLAGLVVGLFVLGCMAAAIMAIVTLVLRFQKSVLSREGYLTHTLPVGSHALIWSRLIVAFVYILLTVLVVLGCICVAVFQTGIVQQFIYLFQVIFVDMIAEFKLYGALALIQFILLVVIAGLAACLMFYAALSIGHSFANHKMLLSVVFYFVLYTATQVVNLLTLVLLTGAGPIRWLAVATTAQQVMADVQWLLLILLLVYLLTAAVYYVLTVGMLKRRLNLQ